MSQCNSARLMEEITNGGSSSTSDIMAIQTALKGIVTKHEINYLRGLKSHEQYMQPYSTHLWKELDRLG
jgi:hypothetical protein